MYIYTLMRKIMVEGKWKWILRERCKKKKIKFVQDREKFSSLSSICRMVLRLEWDIALSMRLCSKKWHGMPCKSISFFFFFLRIATNGRSPKDNG